MFSSREPEKSDEFLLIGCLGLQRRKVYTSIHRTHIHRLQPTASIDACIKRVAVKHFKQSKR